MKQLFIPNKINVGFQERSGTYRGTHQKQILEDLGKTFLRQQIRLRNK